MKSDLMNSKECNAVVIYMYSSLNCRRGEVQNATNVIAGHRQHATSACNVSMQRQHGTIIAIYDHGGSLSFLDVAM